MFRNFSTSSCFHLDLEVLTHHERDLLEFGLGHSCIKVSGDRPQETGGAIHDDDGYSAA